MLYAVKDNKRLRITETERATHLALGYDIAQVEGKKMKVVDVAPAKTVPYGKYQEAMAKIEALEQEVARLKAAGVKTDKAKGSGE